MSLLEKIFGPAVPQLTPQDVKDRTGEKGSSPYLLDVRQPEEFREGHIAGARLVPLGTLAQRMKDLPRNREIICICHSGNRSSSAARQLAAAGYQVSNLRGGMSAWSRAGLPVKKGS
jgi:rhodanese-related sulfurtransferase